MRLAHVRERHAPVGTAWRLAAALDDPSVGSSASTTDPAHWLDLEVARRRAIAARPELEHDLAVFRRPVTTLDDHLARGLRIATLGAIADAFERRDVDDALLDAAAIETGSPILRPTSLRDGYGFEGHVKSMWERRGATVPEIWYELPVFYHSNVSEIRGPDDPVWAPRGSTELDFELEVAALIDTPAIDLALDQAEDAIGGYMIFNDWSARDLQREETVLRLGPAKGKDFANSFGPWLVTPDEIEDRRSGRGYDLLMTAHVNGEEISRGRWSDAVHGLPALAARASADVHLRPSDLLGSGTVGTGCLLEVRERTLGRYLEPGDLVELAVERLGSLRSPVVAHPG
jgi:fumarylacetoacetate (FAA) hydrolase